MRTIKEMKGFMRIIMRLPGICRDLELMAMKKLKLSLTQRLMALIAEKKRKNTLKPVKKFMRLYRLGRLLHSFLYQVRLLRSMEAIVKRNSIKTSLYKIEKF